MNYDWLLPQSHRGPRSDVQALQEQLDTIRRNRADAAFNKQMDAEVERLRAEIVKLGEVPCK